MSSVSHYRGLTLMAYIVCGFLSLTMISNVRAGTSSLQQIVDQLFVANNIEVVHGSAAEKEYPSWAVMDPTLTHQDLSYRVQTVLPFSGDKNAQAYIIYPKAGVVVPVMTPKESDLQLIKKGQSFNHYGYLEVGALHYMGLSPSGGKGSNMVIAAHSSYTKDAAGRYKTVFQALPLTQKGDIIWYFEKNTQGSYDRYEYTIRQSYPTEKSNVSITMNNNDNKSYLTTYGCYPIGSNDRRRVNVAELTKTTLSHSTLTPIEQTHEAAPAKLESKPIIITMIPKISTKQTVKFVAKTNFLKKTKTITITGRSTKKQRFIRILDGSTSK